MGRPRLPSDRRLVGFRGGPKDGDMERIDLVGKRIVFLDGVTYEVTDPGLANGILFADYVEGT